MIIETSFYTGIIDENNNLVVEYNYDGYGNIISILVNKNVNEEEVTVSGVINSIVTGAVCGAVGAVIGTITLTTKKYTYMFKCIASVVLGIAVGIKTAIETEGTIGQKNRFGICHRRYYCISNVCWFNN